MADVIGHRISSSVYRMTLWIRPKKRNENLLIISSEFSNYCPVPIMGLGFSKGAIKDSKGAHSNI